MPAVCFNEGLEAILEADMSETTRVFSVKPCLQNFWERRKKGSSEVL